MKRSCLYFSAALLFCSFAGCFGNRGIPVQFVEGIVTLDGQPLEAANVMFVPKDAEASQDDNEGKKLGTYPEPASGRTDAQGKYILTSMHGKGGKGVLVGEYVITVTKTENYTPPGSPPKTPDDPAPPLSRIITPKVYSNRLQTPLTAIVVKGNNKFDFDLKSKP
jgi:hypothetical protein